MCEEMPSGEDMIKTYVETEGWHHLTDSTGNVIVPFPPKESVPHIQVWLSAETAVSGSG